MKRRAFLTMTLSSLAGAVLYKHEIPKMPADWKRVIIPLPDQHLPMGKTVLTATYRIPRTFTVRSAQLQLSGVRYPFDCNSVSQHGFAPIRVKNGDQLILTWTLDLERTSGPEDKTPLRARQASITISEKAETA